MNDTPPDPPRTSSETEPTVPLLQEEVWNTNTADGPTIASTGPDPSDAPSPTGAESEPAWHTWLSRAVDACHALTDTQKALAVGGVALCVFFVLVLWILGIPLSVLAPWPSILVLTGLQAVPLLVVRRFLVGLCTTSSTSQAGLDYLRVWYSANCGVYTLVLWLLIGATVDFNALAVAGFLATLYAVAMTGACVVRVIWPVGQGW